MNRRALIFGAFSLGAVAASAQLRPSRRAAEALQRIDLESQVPLQFMGWQVDTSTTPVLPSPELQESLDKIYTQLIARTYVHADGSRVMFTIAYGADQATDATSVHRPEFCYSAQGFAVKGAGTQRLKLASTQLDVRRLEARLGSRYEPITYWVTLNDKAVLPGFQRKLKQIELGLAGLIPDGMLVRVSTINIPEAPAYKLQERFIAELEQSVSPQVRSRYFGTA
ncbi:MAG: EpsI family protein [Burkholderiales bacterium]|nr:EpsI family protein [Burkholderiales bacterium]